MRARGPALVLVVLALLGAGGWWALRDGPEEGLDSRDSSESPPLDASAEGIRPEAAPIRPAAQAWLAAIEGRVIDASGRPVPGAAVCAEAASRRCVEAHPEDGRFRIPSLPPGSYLLHANLGEQASAPVGPVPLEPGEELRELSLVLELGGAIAGTVRDARDGRAIAGARVLAGASATSSDAKGRYRLGGLAAGHHLLTASADGYVSRQAEVEVAQGRERQGADVHLERGARVRGRVANRDGTLIAGAEIFAAGYGFAARAAAMTPVAMSGVDGQFAGVVAPGRLQLIARAAGYAEARSDELEVAVGDEREANLTLGAGGAIFGTVLRTDGVGEAGCKMVAFDAVHGRAIGEGQSGLRGEFALAGLPQAVYVIVASCASGRAEAGAVTVAEGAEASVELRLGAARLAGRVLDDAGAPVAAAVVAVRVDGSAGPETPVATSGPDGTFAATGLQGERFTVSATAASGRSERAGIPAGTLDLELRIEAAELAGTVEDDRGAPVPDFVVYVEPAQFEQGRPRHQRFLAPSGRFRMALAPGRYSVKAGAPGHAPSAVQPVEVRRGGASSSVRLVVQRGATVRGVTLGPDDRPLPGVRVATHPNMLWAFGRAAPVPAGAEAVSAADGSFALMGVGAAEKLALHAYKEGYQLRALTQVAVRAGGEVADVIVRMRKATDSEPDPGFAGIGASLTQRGGACFVAEAYEGGPAREAGIRPGDQLVAVDGFVPTGAPLADVVGRIRGQVGTAVLLVVRRDGRDFTVAVPRAHVRF